MTTGTEGAAGVEDFGFEAVFGPPSNLPVLPCMPIGGGGGAFSGTPLLVFGRLVRKLGIDCEYGCQPARGNPTGAIGIPPPAPACAACGFVRWSLTLGASSVIVICCRAM